MGKIIDITGLVFGRLTVLKSAGLLDGRKMFWMCKCACGNYKIAPGQLLRNGGVQSCGCLREDTLRTRSTIHGNASRDKGETAEYVAWCAMIQRCTNPNRDKYERYGGRGIKVCKRWLNSFENFLSDMGIKPGKKYSIERNDSDGNYSCGKCDECVDNGWKSNCRWATFKDQCRNRGNNVWMEYRDKKMIKSDWARFFKISVATLSEMMEKKKSFGDVYAYYTQKNKIRA